MKNPKFNLVLLTIFLLGLGGCNSTQDADFVKAANDTNIKKVGSAYQLYASRFGYTGPKSKEELKNFLMTNESIVKNLELIGIDREKIDDYFISDNDGQEFEFRWGVFVNPDTARANEPMVFEKVGLDGIRLVMLSSRKILEIENEKKYQELLNGRVNAADAKTDLELEEEAADDPVD